MKRVGSAAGKDEVELLDEEMDPAAKPTGSDVVEVDLERDEVRRGNGMIGPVGGEG